MRAQKVEDPSMEDILSSIRKIISEDEKESGNNQFASNNPAANERASQPVQDSSSDNRGPLTSAFMQNDEAGGDSHLDDPDQIITPQAIERAYQSETEAAIAKPQAHPSPERPVQHREPISNYQSNPGVLNTRSPADLNREEMHPPAVEPKPVAENFQPTQKHESPLLEVVEDNDIVDAGKSHANEPDPVAQPVVQKQPASPANMSASAKTTDHIVETDTDIVEAAAPKREIPGFVESKPAGGEIRTRNLKAQQAGDEELHPAIANAKSYMAIKDEPQPQVEARQEKEEMEPTPVFKEAQHSSVNMPAEQLISPDTVDRRSTEERRTHPMRRQADQAEQEFKRELMSPSSSDSVHDAFEQLKKMATENIDANVREVLRPLLREWLDNNLPSMVERMVREEIERVSRGD